MQSDYSPHEKAFDHIKPCSAGVLGGLQSSNWKQRLTSMEEVQQQVQDMKENLEGVNSVLIQGMSFLPGWSEKNFQVDSVSYRQRQLGAHVIALMQTCIALYVCSVQQSAVIKHQHVAKRLPRT